MASHEVERERFQALMESEGMSREISRRILRHAQTVQRLAELACSSEAADRDQVRCPGGEPSCLCRDYGSFDGHAKRETVTCGTCGRSWCGLCDPAPSALCHYCHGRGRSTNPIIEGRPARCEHGTVPRYMVQTAHAERLIREWCEKAGNGRRVGQIGVEEGRAAFVPIFQGDPRGACVKLKVPSGRTDDWGQTGICVPTR